MEVSIVLVLVLLPSSKFSPGLFEDQNEDEEEDSETDLAFSVGELLALRRVAPRSAAQSFLSKLYLQTPSIPPLHAAGLSQRNNRYR